MKGNPKTTIFIMIHYGASNKTIQKATRAPLRLINKVRKESPRQYLQSIMAY